MLWLLPALASTGPRYNDDELRLADERPHRDDLVEMGRRVQQKRGLRFVYRGEPTKVGALPDEALAAIWVADQDGRSVHYDLRMPDSKGVLRPVSVRLDGEVWTLSTRQGTGRQPVDPNRLGPELKAAGLVVKDTRPWEAHIIEGVVLALSHLTPAERRALQGVRVARQSGRGDDGNKAATYFPDGAWIALYDPSAAGATRFVGSPDDPYPPASFVILHELAHAIADRPIRGILVEHEERRQRAMQDQVVLREDIDRFNDALGRYRMHPTPEEATRLEVEEGRLNVRKEALGKEFALLNAAVQAMGGARGERITPVAAAYQREVGHPITAYGETSPDEAFAEAFALYHLDPEALEQVAPGALAWFRAGKHLEDP